MARKILCTECDKQLLQLANKYSELYESIGGESNSEYRCDDCGKDIKKGDKCFASVLLPNKNHPNYPFQKPESWMNAFITKTKNI